MSIPSKQQSQIFPPPPPRTQTEFLPSGSKAIRFHDYPDADKTTILASQVGLRGEGKDGYSLSANGHTPTVLTWSSSSFSRMKTSQFVICFLISSAQSPHDSITRNTFSQRDLRRKFCLKTQEQTVIKKKHTKRDNNLAMFFLIFYKILELIEILMMGSLEMNKITTIHTNTSEIEKWYSKNNF